ncbi:MAG: hypothetical protein HY923_06720 [Elusimicrobia bacterium]|nr:hypothetical protein [Elusimicrobiota bacterium]
MRANRTFPAVLAALAACGPADPSALPAGSDPARIEVRRPREDLILARDPAGAWRLGRTNDLADAQAVELLLGGLRALTFGPALGSDSAVLASGLGPADSLRVRALDSSGAVLFDGVFGRRAFGRSAYFRAKEGDAVRLASGLDPEPLLRPVARWREPRLMPGGCSAGLEIAGRGGWRRVSDDASRALCALRAERWSAADAEAPGGFDKPLLKVRAPDGRGFTVGERRGDARLARVDGRAGVLEISARAIEETAADLIGSKP